LYRLAFAYYYNRKMKKAFKRNKQRIGDINARIEDNLSGIRVVKSFANENEEMDKFQVENRRFVDSKRNSYLYMAKYHSGLGIFISTITFAVIFFGALFISEQRINTPDLIAFILYITNLIDPVKKLINFTEQFQEGATGFERFMEILEIQPDIQDSPNAFELKNVQGDITFQHVGFRYNSKSDYVFDDINLHVEPGDYVALVGSSGVGKTTICSLLPRFYEVTCGQILIDGQDIKDVKLSSLRQNIGIVQQDVYLFAGTIMDNIRYGKFNATDEEVIEAARKANAHDFIMRLPNGYDTLIGEGEMNLSGGERQRLSIARAVLLNSKIIIFDEATAAMDTKTERMIQEAIHQLQKDKTIIMIAHRLSTLKDADNLIIIEDKKIVEEGTMDTLIKNKKQFYSLYKVQKEAMKHIGVSEE